MSNAGGFYTMKCYALMAEGGMTSAMEDYLEMIARLARDNEPVRVGDLSRMLHVRAPSVTKMVRQLDKAGFLQAERYGTISLTEKGRDAGGYLLYRHGVLHRFLRLLNGTENELEQVEKLEHFLNRDTVENLARLCARLDGEKGAG